MLFAFATAVSLAVHVRSDESPFSEKDNVINKNQFGTESSAFRKYENVGKSVEGSKCGKGNMMPATETSEKEVARELCRSKNHTTFRKS